MIVKRAWYAKYPFYHHCIYFNEIYFQAKDQKISALEQALEKTTRGTDAVIKGNTNVHTDFSVLDSENALLRTQVDFYLNELREEKKKRGEEEVCYYNTSCHF